MNLTDDQVAWTLYALRDLISRRKLGGQPMNRELIALFNHLTTSANGSETSTARAQLEPQEDLIDTFEAAEILRCTPRWVTQIHADLDGVKIGRTWVFRRHTVTEYAEVKGTDGDRNRLPHPRSGAVPPRTA